MRFIAFTLMGLVAAKLAVVQAEQPRPVPPPLSVPIPSMLPAGSYAAGLRG